MSTLIDLNAQVRLGRTQKGYTWEVVVPVLGIGAAAFTDAVAIAVGVDEQLTARYGTFSMEPAKAVK